MLKVKDNLNVKEELKSIDVSNSVSIYTRIMTCKNEGKTAIYIHGGGSCGNHSMCIRPAKWMFEKGLFNKMILPDKRGEGASSPLTEKIKITDHALDMKQVLDKLNIQEKVTAIGISNGGPTALTLASIDERIDEVILISSSPSIKSANGLGAFLHKHNLLQPIVKLIYTKLVGKNPAKYPDMDSIYEINSNKELKKIFLDAIKSTEKSRLNSLLIQNESTLDVTNGGIDAMIKLDIPIYQVIGDKDEVGETDLSEYIDRFPKLNSIMVNNADHQACLVRANEFYETLLQIYKAS